MIRKGTRNLFLLTVLLAAASLLFAQTASFEVASVKPNTSNDGNSTINTRPGGRFVASNASLRSLVREAYRLQDFQLVDAPDWTGAARFDIVAKAETEITYDEGRLMLQSLLTERFALVVHRETRQLPIYALVMAKADGKPGPQLTKAEIDCTDPAARKPAGQPPILCGASINTSNGAATMRVGSIPISHLVPALSGFVNRIVVDQTGLSGAYDATLTWSVSQAADAPGASIFTALQEQLGLKLESTRGPVEVVAIERVERPSPD